MVNTHTSRGKTALVLVPAAALAVLAAGSPAQAQAQAYSFVTLGSFNGANGQNPLAGLILSGNSLYGTTSQGGTSGDGTVFSIPVTGGTPTTLTSFNGANGQYLTAGLTLSGNTLYGTTTGTGNFGRTGTIFSLPVTGGAPTTLYTFSDLGSNNTNSDGSIPQAGLIVSGNTLYGTTYGGGTSGDGTVFSIPVTGGTLKTLATFHGADGSSPVASLTLSGNTLYGTTVYGGSSNKGTVFSLPVTGGTPTVLTSFNGANGDTLEAGLILSGNTLYGTTQQGGASDTGTVFSLPVTGGAPTTLFSFGPRFSNGGNANGYYPDAGLTLIGNTLYGTTGNGGPSIGGTVFSLPVAGGTLTTLASFSVGGPNGSFPAAGLISVGNTLYGTTEYGGASNKGTVFALVPVPEPSTWGAFVFTALGVGTLGWKARKRAA